MDFYTCFGFIFLVTNYRGNNILCFPIEKLEEKLKQEREDKILVKEIPYHYREISSALLIQYEERERGEEK